MMGKGEGGFTLIEVLVVIGILGILATVAVLAVTQFIGSGTLESAKSEFKQAQTAVAACMADAGANQFDNTTARKTVGWNGGPNLATVDVDHDGNADYDGADYVHGLFKASYLVDDNGEVWGIGTGGHTWTGLRWGENGWEWAD